MAKSPACANVALEYRITPRGVEEVEGAVVPEVVQRSVVDMSIASDMDFGMAV